MYPNNVYQDASVQYFVLSTVVTVTFVNKSDDNLTGFLLIFSYCLGWVFIFYNYYHFTSSFTKQSWIYIWASMHWGPKTRGPHHLNIYIYRHMKGPQIQLARGRLKDLNLALFSGKGARCSSVVIAFAHGAMCHRINPSWGGPIELFLVPASAPRLV